MVPGSGGVRVRGGDATAHLEGGANRFASDLDLGREKEEKHQG